MPKNSVNGFTQKRRYGVGLSFPTLEEKEDFRVVMENIKSKVRKPEYQFVRELVEEYGVKIGAIKARERE
jgi:hypothetical protein